MNTSTIMNTQQLAMAKRKLDIDRRQLEIKKKLLLTELERSKVVAVNVENYELAISIRDKISEMKLKL
jgi:protein-arginine kinase activator protein McsA